MKWLSRRPLRKRDPIDSENLILQAIRGSCMKVSMAAFIAESLSMHLHSKGTQLTAVRATPLYLLSEDEKSYPVIEWIESDDSYNIIIFYIENQVECVECQASWLMHSIIKTAGEQEKSRLNWSVPHISQISRLFGLAHHFFGVLQWSEEDKLVLYCHQNIEDGGLPEYYSFFTNLSLTMHQKYETCQVVT